jgi:hypothetical protein
MPLTREQLLNQSHSGAQPLTHIEETERARDAELATQWLPATSPQGHPCQVQVSQAEVLDDMRRAGWRVPAPAAPHAHTRTREPEHSPPADREAEP